jgi:Protein of unknown function (DUF3102)
MTTTKQQTKARKKNTSVLVPAPAPTVEVEPVLDGEVILPNEKSRAEWTIHITATWKQAVVGIIETGQSLIEAKEQLAKHGEWMPMFEGRELPFSLRAAEMLMTIARHRVLSNSNHASHLPSAWTTLAELARLSEEEAEAAIECGDINPEMSRKDAQLLGRSPPDEGAPDESAADERAPDEDNSPNPPDKDSPPNPPDESSSDLLQQVISAHRTKDVRIRVILQMLEAWGLTPDDLRERVELIH